VKPLVWSERPEPNASGLKDCTYSAGLSALIYGGHTAFPLGIYTVAEREALERSDAQPNETGASLSDLIVAVKARYHLTLTQNAANTLPVHLARTNVALVVQGKMGNFPVGSDIRRWDPDFTGAHCVCVVALGGDRFRWLDPLAPMKFAGDVVSDLMVKKFAIGSGRSIVVKLDQFVPVKVYTQAQLDVAVATAKVAGYAQAKSIARKKIEEL
jgi:hypothetical protein